MVAGLRATADTQAPKPGRISSYTVYISIVEAVVRSIHVLYTLSWYKTGGAVKELESMVAGLRATADTQVQVLPHLGCLPDSSQVDMLVCSVRIRQLWRGKEPGLTKSVSPNTLRQN
jgi:hypothetical protein